MRLKFFKRSEEKFVSRIDKVNSFNKKAVREMDSFFIGDLLIESPAKVYTLAMFIFYYFRILLETTRRLT